MPGGEPYAQNGARSSSETSFDLAQINHYALRSLDSWLIKRARGGAFKTDHVMGLEYWKCFDRKGCQDETIRRYDAGAARYMDLFRRDTQLMKLHQTAVDWHERKAAELRADPAMQELITAIESRLIPPPGRVQRS